jgi:hypothetical protein
VSGEKLIAMKTSHVFAGMALTAGLHVGFYMAVWILIYIVGAVQAITGLWVNRDLWFFILFGAIGGISVLQLTYILPVIAYFRRTGSPAIARGLIIGASITFLLNGTCWGWFLIAKPRIGG